MYCFYYTEGKSFKSMKERNISAGKKWRDLSEEEKEKFKAPVDDYDNSSNVNTWHETQRILKNMKANVSMNN